MVPVFSPLAATTCSVGHFFDPVTLIEAIGELGGGFVAGAWARKDTTAKKNTGMAA